MRKQFAAAAGFLAAFALWTAAVLCVDVQPIGPMGSSVGLGAVNGFFRDCIGVNFALYEVTDWLGLVPIGICVGFGVLGLFQWIRRGRISAVDRSVLLLGVFYLAVMAVYILFEMVTVNYRPVLIGGVLEKSYPSSTTVLVLCVMTTAMMELGRRISKAWLRRGIFSLMAAFTVFMAVGRLLSGVHWLSDILGGMLLSGGLVTLYGALLSPWK